MQKASVLKLPKYMSSKIKASGETKLAVNIADTARLGKTRLKVCAALVIRTNRFIAINEMRIPLAIRRTTVTGKEILQL